ncbi:MAG: hypothetical protein JNK82_41350 [Myxococcaceae bacterium]|nr:hypothetical protein [Myxococcaceae bacterium]
MKEQAVGFGPLAGVLTEPEVPRLGAPAALMWNVGINHRVGAYRIWVDLSRRLAKQGITSLRFDLAGMGDSDLRKTANDDPDRALDLEEAMAFVTKRTGIERFAPVGFCSGVDQLHALGLREPRVVAMAYVEGYAWPTPGHRLRAGLKYLRGPYWAWRLERLKRHKTNAVDPERAESAAGADMFSRKELGPKQFAAELRQLLARKVKLFFAYFGIQTSFNHERQFEEMTGIAPGGDLTLHFQGGADHILYRTEDRQLTIERLARWYGAIC